MRRVVPEIRTVFLPANFHLLCMLVDKRWRVSIGRREGNENKMEKGGGGRYGESRMNGGEAGGGGRGRALGTPGRLYAPHRKRVLASRELTSSEHREASLQSRRYAVRGRQVNRRARRQQPRYSWARQGQSVLYCRRNLRMVAAARRGRATDRKAKRVSVFFWGKERENDFANKL